MLLHTYRSPLGELTACGDLDVICGLWFSDQRQSQMPGRGQATGNSPLFSALDCWLDRYFAGEDPGTPPPVRTAGTAFQEAIWALARQVPWGETATYGQLARQLGRPGAAQAVGGALGRNPVLLLIPCHRVLGTGGTLTGYAGGLFRKAALLELERGGGA